MMLMAAAALASCEKQNTLNEPEAKKGTYTYTLSATAPDMIETDGAGNAQAPISKTDYNASGVFSWSAGDQISVLFHKDDDNKFFTFTTTGSGSSASFSGTIDEGYTIGASDGDALDKKIWALFPASANHTYTAGETNPIHFYVQPEVDFTASHFSANLPMYDKLTAEGVLSFKHLTGAYKFIIKNIDASVNKIKLAISNQETYALSGLWPIDGDPKLNYDYADPGSANSCMTLTANVVSNQAVFYIPCRRNSGSSFQPIISLYDAETGFILNKVTASVAKTSPKIGYVQPISISAPGTGSPFWSAYGIKWGDETTSVSGDTSAEKDAIQLMKIKAESRYIYVYLEIVANKLLRDPSYGYANRSYLYLADGTTGAHNNYNWNQLDNINYEGWLLKNNALSFTINNTGNGVVGEKPSYIGELNGTVYMEIAIDRSNANLAFLQNVSAETRYVAFYITTAYKVGSGSTTYGTISGYAPAKSGDMFSFSLPGYVAP